MCDRQAQQLLFVMLLLAKHIYNVTNISYCTQSGYTYWKSS